jgi:hypothetical protein
MIAAQSFRPESPGEGQPHHHRVRHVDALSVIPYQVDCLLVHRLRKVMVGVQDREKNPKKPLRFRVVRTISPVNYSENSR